MTCKAADIGKGRMGCDACGLEWGEADARPPCDPITFKAICARMLDEVCASATSLEIVTKLRERGDPARERRRLAELKAAQRVIDWVAGDEETKKRMAELTRSKTS